MYEVYIGCISIKKRGEVTQNIYRHGVMLAANTVDHHADPLDDKQLLPKNRREARDGQDET